MSDTNLVLDLTSYLANTSYSFSFDTIINVDYAGFEYRYPKIFSHKLTVNVSDYVLQGGNGAKCSGYTKQGFLNFFDSVKGSQDTFLVKCLLDYRAANEGFDPVSPYSANQVSNTGVIQQVNPSNLNEYIFVKRYSHQGISSYKTIYNIETLSTVYSQTNALIPASQYSLVRNATTGTCRLVRNASMPAGVIPSFFDGTFYYRVRFASPTLEIEQISSDLFKISNFELVSHIEPERFKLFTADYPRNTNTANGRSLLLSGSFQTTNTLFPSSTTPNKPFQTYTYGWRNENLQAASTGLKGVESRSRESTVSVLPRNIDNMETSLILNQFIANKGRLLMFNYSYGNNFGSSSVLSRFDSDTLTLNLISYANPFEKDCDGLWEASNLSFKTYPNAIPAYSFANPITIDGLSSSATCVDNAYAAIPTGYSTLGSLDTTTITPFNYGLTVYSAQVSYLNNPSVTVRPAPATTAITLYWKLWSAGSRTDGDFNVVLQGRRASGDTRYYAHYILKRYQSTNTFFLEFQSDAQDYTPYSSLNLTLVGTASPADSYGNIFSNNGYFSPFNFKRNGTSTSVNVSSLMNATGNHVGTVTFASSQGIVAISETFTSVDSSLFTNQTVTANTINNLLTVRILRESCIPVVVPRLPVPSYTTPVSLFGLYGNLVSQSYTYNTLTYFDYVRGLAPSTAQGGTFTSNNTAEALGLLPTNTTSGNWQYYGSRVSPTNPFVIQHVFVSAIQSSFTVAYYALYDYVYSGAPLAPGGLAHVSTSTAIPSGVTIAVDTGSISRVDSVGSTLTSSISTSPGTSLLSLSRVGQPTPSQLGALIPPPQTFFYVRKTCILDTSSGYYLFQDMGNPIASGGNNTRYFPTVNGSLAQLYGYRVTYL